MPPDSKPKTADESDSGAVFSNGATHKTNGVTKRAVKSNLGNGVTFEPSPHSNGPVTKNGVTYGPVTADDRVDNVGLTDGKILELPPGMEDRKLVGVDGKWYDVTSFVEHHPGGPIIERFVGQDATQVFHAYGHEGVLANRKPCGTYTLPQRHPADADFEKLRLYFMERGFFKTDYTFYAGKISVIAMLWMAVWVCVTQFESSWVHYFGAVCLAFFWQQSGFVMHEFMHSQVVRKSTRDRAGGVFFGTVCFGISSHWWRDEHIIHHAMTNTMDHNEPFADPQMWEGVWAQHKNMFTLFQKKRAYWIHLMQWCFIKIQHFTFVPVVMMIGRFEIVTDSFRKERRPYEWVGGVLHWMWMVPLLSYLPTWKEVVIFYCIGAWIQGIFHFQLILSHYCKLHLPVDQFHSSSWYTYQVLTNMNLDAWRFMDWYYGGLNFHIEHHLFPKMARKHLREAGDHVKAVCEKHGIEYDIASFPMALWRTLLHLKETGTHYSIDPR